MKGDLCGKILSRGIEQQNAVGLEKISVDRDAAPLIVSPQKHGGRYTGVTE